MSSGVGSGWWCFAGDALAMPRPHPWRNAASATRRKRIQMTLPLPSPEIILGYFGRRGAVSVAQVSAQNLGANLDWIRAKARFELSMLLVRTKTAGQKGAFAHDDYRM